MEMNKPAGFENIEGIQVMPPNPNFMTGRDYVRLNRFDKNKSPGDLIKEGQEIEQKRYRDKEGGVQDLANITLFSDGATVYECTSAEEVVDLLQGGQGVFGIAVSGAMRELTGAIAEFPGERADGGESIAAPEDELASRRKSRDRKIG
jgi:hypothetical protein